MRSLTVVGLRLGFAAFVLSLIGGLFRPFPGFLMDAINVLMAAAMINLLVSFDMFLTQRQAGQRELAAGRARYVAAMEEQNGPMQLRMLMLPPYTHQVCVRCEEHGVHPGPALHYHSEPWEYADGVAKIPDLLRACDGDCAPCVACGDYH